MRLRPPVVRQRDEVDCGPAALLSILRFWGGDAPMSQVRARAGTSRRGSTLLGLRDTAEWMGFEARGVRTSYATLREIGSPFLAHLVMKDNRTHFVAVFEVGPHGVRIGDPAVGRRRIRRRSFEAAWTSRAILLLTPRGELVSIPEPRWLPWLIGLIGDDRVWVMQSLFLGGIVTAAGLLTALFVQLLVDRFIPNGDLTMIVASGAFLAVLVMLRCHAGYARSRFLLRLNRDVGIRVNRDFLSRLYRLPLTFFRSRPTGDITARMADGMRIQAGVTGILGTIVIDGLLISGSLGFLVLLEFRFAVAALAVTPVYVLFLARGVRRLRRFEDSTMAAYATVESSYVDSIEGISAVLDSGTGAHFAAETNRLFGRFEECVETVGKSHAGLGYTTELIAGALVVGALVWGSVLVVEGQLRLGQLVAAYSVLAGMVPSIDRFVRAIASIPETAVAARRFHEIATEPQEPQSGRPLSGIRSGVTLDRVGLGWPNRPPLFESLSMNVPIGRITGLRGPNGCGKTSLLRLLNRSLTPQRGRVLVDGRAAEEFDLATYRSSVSLVPAFAHVFDAPLALNVLMGRCHDTTESVLSWLEDVGFSSFLKRFPEGWATPVGAGGRTLSSGERQALGLMRGLVSRPDVLLIDEGMNSADRQLAERMLGIAVRYAVDHAVLIVSHDPSVLARADRVIELDRARIADTEQPRPTGDDRVSRAVLVPAHSQTEDES